MECCQRGRRLSDYAVEGRVCPANSFESEMMLELCSAREKVFAFKALERSDRGVCNSMISRASENPRVNTAQMMRMIWTQTLERNGQANICDSV